MAFVGLLLLTSCSQNINLEDETLRIGSILALSGATSRYGINVRNGMDLALDHINENNGINGKQLKISGQIILLKKISSLMKTNTKLLFFTLFLLFTIF